ncbi:hypothetical protein OO258_16450 [Pseudomonas sp. DCB_BI]|uniref:hypothetical protein n=1 Tax=Pseudomonas sp. DCB_BI TaxID=2993594 RepID=UPI00224B047F|nr:hypothetical protein [Pseudomonas sp. DCB_BI]MCX2889831.1 hypothetical protein [Pseudomonas sp. DCB_BI]
MTKKQTNKLSSTTIHGTPPAWNDAEFNRRLRIGIHAYENTSECTVMVNHPLEHEWLKLVAQHVAEGYTLDRRWPIYHAELTNSVPMVKPETLQVTDKEAIKAKVKADYVQHLQSQLDEYKAKLARQLVEAQEEKERRVLEQAKAKRLSDAAQEAQDCYGELTIPHGFPEEKPAIFTTDL